MIISLLDNLFHSSYRLYLYYDNRPFLIVDVVIPIRSDLTKSIK